MPTLTVLRCLSLSLIVGAAALLAACEKTAPPLVLLFTIDTLRADHLTAYGSKELPTPHLDGIGQAGAIVERAYAPFPRTTQSFGTIMTGLHPLRHGADGLGLELLPRHPTMAQLFHRAGYETAAFASNLVLRPGRGFELGFDLYSNPQPRWHQNGAAGVTNEALGWLRDHLHSPKPLFLWVHYLDPHWAYKPPEDMARLSDPSWTGEFDLFDKIDNDVDAKGPIIFRADVTLKPRVIEHMRHLYDGEIASTDREAGRLLAGLDDMGYGKRAIVIFASDHGESLGEHRYWFAHGEYLYDDTLRVPWMLRAPGKIPPGTRLAGDVNLADVLPTVLELAGLASPKGIDGVSLVPLLSAGGAQRIDDEPMIHLSDHMLVYPENPRRPVPGRAGRWWALREGALKLIRIPLGEGKFEEELYDVRKDPGETVNLVTAQPETVSRMRDRLNQRARVLLEQAQAAEPSGTPSEVEIEALRSLGYLR